MPRSTVTLDLLASGLPEPVINDRRLPLISIVTPSYNQGSFIRSTIESVLGQEYPNIEYWVIDGGSSDETLKVIREYEHDPRFHWISEPDRGQSDAINKGLTRCQGEMFGWLNSDDLFLPGALARVAAAWQREGQAVLVYGRSRLIDAAGRDLGYYGPQSTSMTFAKLLRLDSIPIQPATFMPCALVRELGGVDERLHYAMDVDLFARLAARVPFCYVPADIASFRIHPSSKTIAQARKFIADIHLSWGWLADEGLIGSRRAHAYADMYAARILLTPENRLFGAALGHLAAAVRGYPPALLRAIVILITALARLLVGGRAWAWVRAAKLKLGM